MPTTVNKQILTFDTSIARPRNFQIFRGETVIVECAFTNYITPIDITGMTASAYWRSKAMAEESSDLWYNGTVEIVNKKAVWTWESSNDDGSDGYEWFIKVTDANNFSYRAFGHIEMLGSPSINPSVGPVPQTNYYTKDETDAQIYQATEHLVPDTREINGHALNADVTLTASDVGALPDTYTAPVTSVNNQTGAVTLTASDVGAATLSDIPPVDATPTSGSTNPVSSDGVYDALATKADSTALQGYLPLTGGEISGDLGVYGIIGANSVRSNEFATQDARLVFAYKAKRVDFIESDGHIYNNYQIDFPSKSGTIALTSDIPAAQVNSDWNASSGVAQILNKPTIPEVVAPTSEATTGQAADASATWTGLSGVQTSITETRIQMALEDGAFALPQTVVELWALTLDTTEIVLLNLSGDVGYSELKAALDEVDDYQGTYSRSVRRITFGTNVTNLNIAPNYEYTYEGTSTPVFQLVDDEQTVLEKQEYLYYRFRNCESIELPINLRSFGLDLGGSILNYTYNSGNNLITDYEIKPLLGVYAASGIQSVAPFAFAGWKGCKRIVYSHSGAFCPAPHFIDYCTNLEVLDLRDIAAFYMVRKQIKVGNRVRTFNYVPEIANVNPNLKIIVSDDNYTTLMEAPGFSTWQPYLVRASDWEYVHHSELPTVPVQSVNGQTGTVVLSASDVGAQTPLTFDNAPTALSTNPVKSDGIYTALSSKQDALTFDDVPTVSSNNPVKSSGIKTALDGKASTADATLTPTYTQTPTYGDWTFIGLREGETVVSFVDEGDGRWMLTTSERTDIENGQISPTLWECDGITATRTRTDITDYVLGSQTDKPLQPAGDYAASSSVELTKQFTEWTVTSNNPYTVFPPYSMEWITDGNGYSYWVLHSGNDATWAFNPAGMNHDATYLSTDDIATCTRTFTGYVLGDQSDKELQAAGDYASASSVTAIADKIPAAATSQNQLADKAWVTSQISATVGNINSILDSINGEVL